MRFKLSTLLIILTVACFYFAGASVLYREIKLHPPSLSPSVDGMDPSLGLAKVTAIALLMTSIIIVLALGVAAHARHRARLLSHRSPGPENTPPPA